MDLLGNYRQRKNVLGNWVSDVVGYWKPGGLDEGEHTV
jgi:hypothetical protein